MTRKEKVSEVKPDAVNKFRLGGVDLCPSEYNFLNLPNVNFYNDCDGDCDECWNTEWEEPVEEPVRPRVRPRWHKDILDKFMRVI